MDDKHASLEIIAPSIEEAVEKGLKDLGLPENAVEVEILDEGNKGFLGIGNRQARVRLTIKGDVPRSETAAATLPETQSQPEPMVTAPQIVADTDEFSLEDEDTVLAIARETVSELLEKMRIRAKVSTHYGEQDDSKYDPPVIVDIHGKDLSILIGRKAATLEALELIARLIVNKELGRSVLLIVDVEGYRDRRERQLRQLAQQMAEQAITTGRRQTLEPMPAKERRIIHIELRENSQVSTESVGDEPRRKVTILPVE